MVKVAQVVKYEPTGEHALEHPQEQFSKSLQLEESESVDTREEKEPRRGRCRRRQVVNKNGTSCTFDDRSRGVTPLPLQSS